MSKIMALDIGDQWTGIAITDNSGIFVKPHSTIESKQLVTFLENFLKTESIYTIIVGYPKTMSGGESEQTRKIVAQKEELSRIFPQISFILWDERLSSKRAGTLTTRKSQAEKLKIHALAAAFILDSYVLYAQNKAQD